MKINNLSLPHPVLGLNDDVQGDFVVHCHVNSDEEDITLAINQKITNDNLQSLIDMGNAEFCVEINCPQTFYREVKTLKKQNEEIILPASNFYNKVILSFYIVSAKTLEDYRPSGLNGDYGSASFEIEKADILAYGGETFFIAEKNDLGLKATKSIMTVQEDTTDREPLKYLVEDEKITIMMSKQDFKKYQDLYSVANYSPIFHAAIAYPALLYALTEYFKKSDEFVDYKWAQALEWKRDNLKLNNSWNEQHIPELAQKILGQPIGRGLGGLEKINEIQDREES